MDQPLWRPTADQIARTQLSAFMGWLAATGRTRVGSFADLHAWSVREPDAFWAAVWAHCEIPGNREGPAVADVSDNVRSARFFPESKLNYAEAILSGMAQGEAIVFRGEDKVELRWTADDVRTAVARVSGFLAECGLAPGDRVAAMLPNLPHAIAALLGTAARGQIWSSCSPDFGPQGVEDRFGQIEPRVLFVVDGYYYAGKTIDLTDKVHDIVARLATVERVIVVPYVGTGEALAASLQAALTEGGRATTTVATWTDAIDRRPEREPHFLRLGFETPLYILFSSGTTGIPKCIVHCAGGALLKHLTEHRFHSDIRPGDSVFYFTTLGWMMWNWLASALGSGARLMLYDGSPFAPGPQVLWDYASAERMTHFGTSAKYIDALNKSDIKPRETHDLAELRCLLSTGSPLVPESFDYVYRDIKPDLHLASISGGTDIVGCFVLGDPTSPVWRGEIQAPALGLAPDVIDDHGRSLVAEKGELVCRTAFPSMPVSFWNDPDGARYRAAYFDRFPGLWHHGDFAEWTTHGGIIIHGRSDATLNPGGVRIGTAEIYRQVEQLPEIVESIVIGQDWDGDVRVVLFVVLKPGVTLDDALAKRVRDQIRAGASPRHVPAKIVAVSDIPRTKSGKITELAVRDVIHGRVVKNKEALANPEALELYRDLAELAT
ncbi:MAG: acetoacetate--CoA ligase [Hyphomicrobiaceae bacterium]